MLEKEKGIDAVTVSTPDHTHAVAGVMAMRMGKHCYCQKPLTHSIHEARLMTQVAREQGVVTQMGNQAHAGEPIRRAVELIQAGIIVEFEGKDGTRDLDYPTPKHATWMANTGSGLYHWDVIEVYEPPPVDLQ